MVIRSDGTAKESQCCLDEDDSSTKSSDDQFEQPPVKYGELVILGYNGSISGSISREKSKKRKSKFVLYRRQKANGIKQAKHYTVKNPSSTQAIMDTKQHSISFTLNRNQAVIIEYTLDEETDMFQIGRSSEKPIDFIVLDTLQAGVDHKNMASTISRFACRILCNRKTLECRVFAAGFDSSSNIFLGEKATKWQEQHEVIDGLTTNGILLMHPPNGAFSYSGEGQQAPMWREVSVGGGIFSVRETRSAPQKGVQVASVSNILQDGTLIDLCGATLLWRSAEGLAKSPTKDYLEELIEKLNAARPVCPVGLNTLVIPRKSVVNNKQQPYVYLNCGHVQGLHDWGQETHSSLRTCPMCLKESSSVVKLCMGIEPSFYVDTKDTGPYCFNPCGHMATENTVKYWSRIGIPLGTNGFESFCPFCAKQLEGHPGYTKLIFN